MPQSRLDRSLFLGAATVIWALAAMLPPRPSVAAPGDPTGLIRRGAEQMGLAMVEGDYAAIARLAHPKLVNLAGGRERLMEMLKAGRERMMAAGSTLAGAETLEVKGPVKAGPEMHAIVIQKLTIKVAAGTLIADSYLLAISGDEGESWSYVDSTMLTPDKKAALFPDFNPDLVIPPRTKPQLIPEKSDAAGRP